MDYYQIIEKAFHQTRALADKGQVATYIIVSSR